VAAKRDAPLAALAQIHVLFHGYAAAAGRVASTVTFIRDSDVRVIVDSGMAPTPAAILDPLDRHTRPNAAGHHDARRRRVWYRRVRASVMACAGSHRRPAGLRSGGAACRAHSRTAARLFDCSRARRPIHPRCLNAALSRSDVADRSDEATLEETLYEERLRLQTHRVLFRICHEHERARSSHHEPTSSCAHSLMMGASRCRST
jgi:hypothetical protein